MSYTSQLIANYDDDSPPDDGSQVANNVVRYSTVKDELADPIKNLAEAINAATRLSDSFATSLEIML